MEPDEPWVSDEYPDEQADELIYENNLDYDDADVEDYDYPVRHESSHFTRDKDEVYSQV